MPPTITLAPAAGNPDPVTKWLSYLPGGRLIGDRWKTDEMVLVALSVQPDIDDELLPAFSAGFPFHSVDYSAGSDGAPLWGRFVAAVPAVLSDWIAFYSGEDTWSGDRLPLPDELTALVNAGKVTLDDLARWTAQLWEANTGLYADDAGVILDEIVKLLAAADTHDLAADDLVTLAAQLGEEDAINDDLFDEAISLAVTALNSTSAND